MIDGRVPHSLLLEVFTDEGVGTMVHPMSTADEPTLDRWAGDDADYGDAAARPWSAARAPWSGTTTGNAYVDLLAGIAVNALGHAHPAVVEAVTAQVATLGHVSQPVRQRAVGARWPSGCSR